MDQKMTGQNFRGRRESGAEGLKQVLKNGWKMGQMGEKGETDQVV